MANENKLRVYLEIFTAHLRQARRLREVDGQKLCNEFETEFDD
jgi:hypothetical protein